MTLSSQKNRASKIVGTQLYMSPEMIHSTIGDEKGDLWAYACIIYEFFVNSYLHIEFDCPEKFEEELSFRLEALKKVLTFFNLACGPFGL
jgi:serine/threonine protein kinase